MDEGIEQALGLRAFHDLRCVGGRQTSLHAIGWGFAGGVIRHGGGVSAGGRTPPVSRTQRAAAWAMEQVEVPSILVLMARFNLSRTAAYRVRLGEAGRRRETLPGRWGQAA